MCIPNKNEKSSTQERIEAPGDDVKGRAALERPRLTTVYVNSTEDAKTSYSAVEVTFGGKQYGS